MADAKVTFETELDTSGLEAGINQLERNGLTTLNFGADGGSFAKLGSKMGQIIGAKIALEIAKAVGDTGMAFDSAMSQVAATMGTTVSQIKPLEDMARAVGETGLYTAVEAAEALNYLALAGWSVDEILAGFPAMMTLAAAGNMNLAKASDIVTDVITAMGLSVEDTTMLIDQMATANNESNLTVTQLGAAFLELGATGRIANGGTAELSTALGILANNGIKGGKAGRQLRNIITALAAPTDKATEALDALGVSAYDSDGNFRPLVDIFMDMNAAMAGFTEEQRTIATREIFNKEDLKSANAFLNTSREGWQELESSIINSEGAGVRMASTMMDNFAGDVKKMNSAVEGAKLEVYDAVEPTLRTLTKLGTTAVKQTVAPLAHYNDLMSFWHGMMEEAAQTLSDPNVQDLLAPHEDFWKPLPVAPIDLLFTPSAESEDKSFWDRFVETLIPSAGAEEMEAEFAPTADAYTRAMIGSMENAFVTASPDLQSIILNAMSNPALLTGGEGATVGEGPTGGVQTTPFDGLALSLIDSISQAAIANNTVLGESLQTALDTAETKLDLSGFETVGEDIAGGIADGIDRGQGAVVAAVYRIVAAALEAAKKAASIHSPSRLFRDEIGANIAAGMAVGVERDAFMLADAVNAAVASAVNFDASGIAKTAIPEAFKSGRSAANAANNAPVIEVPQTVNFNVPVQTPDEFAKTMHLYATYGLQG